MLEPQVVSPYWLQRRWNAVKHRFEDLHDQEEAFAVSLRVMEEQAGFMAHRHPDLTSTDIAQAFMLAGLRVAAAIDSQLHYRFDGFPEPVAELARRCLATCHPDFNPEVAAVVEQVWCRPEDRTAHFTSCGAVLRRLVDSAQFWARSGSRAYVQFITPFLNETNWDPRADVIHFSILAHLTKHPIVGALRQLPSR
jgi:hypothetical protein